MKKLPFICCLLLFFSCEKETIHPSEIVIPDDAIAFLEFKTQTTYEDHLSLYAPDSEDYTFFSSQLNGEDVDLFSSITLEEAGYYELKIDAITTTDTLDLWFQFVIVDSERGEAEWGLPKFTPKVIVDKPFELSNLNFLYPNPYPKDLSLPIIFSSNRPKSEWGDYSGNILIDGQAITIKHGIGSIVLPISRSSDRVDVEYKGASVSLEVEESTPAYIELKGTIDEHTTLEPGGHYHITSDLTISPSVQWQIEKGCIVKINEGVNIFNDGQIAITGSLDKPVIFTCADPSTYWGGFISNGPETSIEITHAIFMQSGFHNTPEYQYGHAKRQALFYHEKSSLILRDFNAINNAGQIFYLHNKSNLTVENVLIQRAISAGEVAGSDAIIEGSTFTDFPEYSETYLDKDNDCIYLSQSNAMISNSTFMWSKDDGIDSGGSKGGNIQIDNCHFEGIFHEAIAMSSGNEVTKNHEIRNSTFFNNGQGVELGYSSPNHTAFVENCHFEDNMIGVRFGDNYDRPVDGVMEVSSCTFHSNLVHDIWNFVRSEWAAKKENLIH